MLPVSTPTRCFNSLRAVGLEVTLALCGLLEDLLVHSRTVGAVGSRGVPVKSPYPSAVVSILGDSVASPINVFPAGIDFYLCK